MLADMPHLQSSLTSFRSFTSIAVIVISVLVYFYLSFQETSGMAYNNSVLTITPHSTPDPFVAYGPGAYYLVRNMTQHHLPLS